MIESLRYIKFIVLFGAIACNSNNNALKFSRMRKVNSFVHRINEHRKLLIDTEKFIYIIKVMNNDSIVFVDSVERRMRKMDSGVACLLNDSIVYSDFILNKNTLFYSSRLNSPGRIYVLSNLDREVDRINMLGKNLVAFDFEKMNLFFYEYSPGMDSFHLLKMNIFSKSTNSIYKGIFTTENSCIFNARLDIDCSRRWLLHD